MDNNVRHAQAQAQGQVQIPDQVMGGEAVAAQGVETGDWRTQLQADSRERIVMKIMDTLKRHLPLSGEEGLQEIKRIAVRYEEKIYTTATSQSDYLRKISLKMLTMETKSFQSNASSISKNPQDTVVVEPVLSLARMSFAESKCLGIYDIGTWIEMGRQTLAMRDFRATEAARAKGKKSAIRIGTRFEVGANVADEVDPDVLRVVIHLQEGSGEGGDALKASEVADSFEKIEEPVRKETEPPSQVTVSSDEESPGTSKKLKAKRMKKSKKRPQSPKLREGTPKKARAEITAEEDPDTEVGLKTRQPRRSVIQSYIGVASWDAFCGNKVEEDQRLIKGLSRDELIGFTTDFQMKALQYNIGLVTSYKELMEEAEKKDVEIIQWKQEAEAKEQEIFDAKEAALKEKTSREVAKSEADKLAVALQTTGRDMSAKLKAEQKRGTDLEAANQKLEEALRQIHHDLQRSIPALRIEGARAFIHSPVFQNMLVKETIKDMKAGQRITLGQLQHKGLLLAEFDPAGVLNLGLTETFEIPAEEEDEAEEVPFEQNEFFELAGEDPEKPLLSESFDKIVTELIEGTSAKMKEGGVDPERRGRDPYEVAEGSKIAGAKETLKKANSLTSKTRAQT